MSSALIGTTKLKVSQLYSQSFIRLNDKKNLFFITHKNGIHVYDISNNKIDEIKLDKSQYSGPYSCVTVSDELIFFCCGSKVIAMGSNLKIIYEMDTFLAVGKIDSIHIHGYRMLLISQNMMNEFLIGGIQIMNKKSRITQSPAQKSQDISQQVFDAKINHSLLLTISVQKPFLILLKSNNQIQLLVLQKQKVKSESTFYQTQTPPTYAFLYPQNQQNQNKILVGTAGGQIIHLEINRKQIKKLWSVSQKKGRIQTICGLKNEGFFVTRQKTIQFWNKNKQLIKEQTLDEKVVCSQYLKEEDVLMYGTMNGSVVEMQNYEKLLKQGRKISQAKQRQQIIKQIQLLRYKKSLLQQKYAAKKQAQSQKLNATMSSLKKKINVKSALTIDYVNLCYNVQLQSDQKICKVIVQGPITLIEEKDNIFFQSENSTPQGVHKIYIIRYENQTNIQIKIKYQQMFNEMQKLNLLVYFSFEARAHNIEIDLKQLSLHQKVAIKSFNHQKNLNKLQINGNFKFEMKMWLTSIFNQFNTEAYEEEYEAACYESIITKNKILIKFKYGHCSLLAQSVIPLLIIKKKLMQKSRQKNISLAFDTNTNPSSVKQFIQGIQPRMKQFMQIKRKYDLLPGLLQIKNELTLQNNQDLLKILQDRQVITNSYKQNSKLQAQIREKIMDFYRCFKALNNLQSKEIEQKSLMQGIQKWDTKSIISTICRE